MVHRLKGTVLMLVLMIIQIILNVIILIGLPAVGALVLIDTLLVILTYVGFNKGQRGWAIFAVVYGALSTVIAFAQGTFLNIGVLILVAGIVALADDTYR